MEKKDILSKAQREGLLGIDEGTKEIKNQGRIVGIALFSLVFIIIALLSIITKHELDYGVRAMFLAYVTGELFMQWKYNESKVFLFLTFTAGFTTILALIEVAFSMLEVTL